MSFVDGRPGRGPLGLLLRTLGRLRRALGRLLSLRQELLRAFVRRALLERVVQHSAGVLRPVRRLRRLRRPATQRRTVLARQRLSRLVRKARRPSSSRAAQPIPGRRNPGRDRSGAGALSGRGAILRVGSDDTSGAVTREPSGATHVVSGADAAKSAHGAAAANAAAALAGARAAG
jgi:hypothetical protein